MGPVFKNLNLTDHEQVAVLDAPESFEEEVATIADRRVVRDLSEAVVPMGGAHRHADPRPEARAVRGGQVAPWLVSAATV